MYKLEFGTYSEGAVAIIHLGRYQILFTNETGKQNVAHEYLS